MGRRVWDKEFFKQKFEEEETNSLQPPSKVAKLVTGAAGSLKSRDPSIIDLEGQVNERKILSITTAKSEQGGFYCLSLIHI